jgi:hypothetical protein
VTRTVPAPWYGAVLVAASLVAVACSGGGGDGEDEGLPTEPFTLGVEVGGCFDRPASPDVTAVPTVDCSAPHDFQLYASAELEGDGFPGDEEVATQALTLCNEQFSPYVGVSPDQSGLVVVPVPPTAEQWEDGVRTVDCTVTIRSPDRLEGSVEGSEQPAG